MSAVQPNILLHLFTAHSCWMKAENHARADRGTGPARKQFSPPQCRPIRLIGVLFDGSLVKAVPSLRSGVLFTCRFYFKRGVYRCVTRIFQRKHID